MSTRNIEGEPVLVEADDSAPAPDPLDEIKRRLNALEKDSHPPAPFIECPECYGVVFENRLQSHIRWHMNTNTRNRS